jgi:hypothetical protein
LPDIGNNMSNKSAEGTIGVERINAIMPKFFRHALLSEQPVWAAATTSP